MQDTKILTVVVPTYNMSSLLKVNLQSLLLTGPYSHYLEVLVINDGSTDDSSHIAHQFAERFPETFIVIDKKNGNYGSCINCGLEIATGKYIKVMDADDSYETSGLEVLLRYLVSLNQEPDLIITPFSNYYIDGSLLSSTSYSIREKEILHFNSIAASLISTNLAMPAITYRTCILREMHYKQTEGISYTDSEWAFIPLFNVKTVSYLNTPIYRVLTGRPGQTTEPDTFVRNYSHVVQVTKSIVNGYYQRRHTFIHSDDYLSQKLYLLLESLYSRYLLHKDLPQRELLHFDDYILSLDESYRIGTESFLIPKTKIPYVKIWRSIGRNDFIHIFHYIKRILNNCIWT